MITLISYRSYWITREEYGYICNWSDGTSTNECSLPWDRIGDAVELK